MGYFRFHRSMQLAPLVRLNMSKSGPSLSVGPNGARVNVGPQGTRTTVGVPGTGVSFISRKSWGSVLGRMDRKAGSAAGNQAGPRTVEVGLRNMAIAAESCDLKELRTKLGEIDDAWRKGESECTEERYLATRQVFVDAIEARKANPDAPYRRAEPWRLAGELMDAVREDEREAKAARAVERKARNAERAAKWRPVLITARWGGGLLFGLPVGFGVLTVLYYSVLHILGFNP